MVFSPTWGPDVSGKSFRSLPRTTYHPDPRRLAQNRAVALKTMTPPVGFAWTWQSVWKKLCGTTAFVP
jgi:hypothetical protein